MNPLYGMPARYMATPPTLEDGEPTALLVDENGALVVTGGGNVSPEEYTTENVTPTRSIDPNTATSESNANVLGTLIQDLKAAGILQ